MKEYMVLYTMKQIIKLKY